MISYLILISGIALVLFGADRLTEGASSLAKRFKVSDMVIGLTVVAFGTSMPEFVVSLRSSINGSGGIAIGNVVGSNIFNSLVIVGCTATVFPIVIQRRTLSRDIPFSLLASVVLLVMCSTTLLDGSNTEVLSRSNGIILLCFFAIFLAYTFASGSQTSAEPATKVEERSLAKCLLFIFIGLAGLIIGGKLFVDSATHIALSWGASEAVVGLTIVAAGTSLPELATSVMAAYKRNAAMAIGNVLGSNVFNVFFILGTSAAVNPLTMGGITHTDLGVMAVSAMFIWIVSVGDYKIRRWEGVLMALGYLAYTAFLVSQI